MITLVEKTVQVQGMIANIRVSLQLRSGFVSHSNSGRVRKSRMHILKMIPFKAACRDASWGLCLLQKLWCHEDIF